MTLTIQDLGALGEFFGSIAVLATLVYLALQTRQNTMAIGAQLDAARLANFVNLNLAGATSSDLQDALAEGASDLEATMLSRRQQYWFAWINTFQWQFIQARRGVLPSYHEPGSAFALQNFFSGSPEFGDLWDRVSQSAYRPDFVEWVDDQRAKSTGQEA